MAPFTPAELEPRVGCGTAHEDTGYGSTTESMPSGIGR